MRTPCGPFRLPGRHPRARGFARQFGRARSVLSPLGLFCRAGKWRLTRAGGFRRSGIGLPGSPNVPSGKRRGFSSALTETRPVCYPKFMRSFFLPFLLALSACAGESRPLSPSEIQIIHAGDALTICESYDVPDLDKCMNETIQVFRRFHPATPVPSQFVADWAKGARACRTAGWEFRSPGFNECLTNQTREIQSARARNAAAWQAVAAGFADGLGGMSAAHGRAATRPAPITCFRTGRFTQCN